MNAEGKIGKTILPLLNERGFLLVDDEVDRVVVWKAKTLTTVLQILKYFSDMIGCVLGALALVVGVAEGSFISLMIS